VDADAAHIRRAHEGDLEALARFAHALARTHVRFDARRFWVPGDGQGAFAAFFRTELASRDAVLLIAEVGSQPVGYAFVRMEAESLEDLCGAGAWLHDLYVEPGARGGKVGRLLVEAAIEAARGLGSASLMLAVSPRNAAARRVFGRMGLRETMIEMRVDFEPG
jgi:GNAT superfamily N-acetyltransferase